MHAHVTCVFSRTHAALLHGLQLAHLGGLAPLPLPSAPRARADGRLARPVHILRTRQLRISETICVEIPADGRSNSTPSNSDSDCVKPLKSQTCSFWIGRTCGRHFGRCFGGARRSLTNKHAAQLYSPSPKGGPEQGDSEKKVAAQ